MMSHDESDDPSDLIKFYNYAENNEIDAVFGNRFIKE